MKGFTSKYNIDRLVWYEVYDNIHRAIGREKQLKAWVGAKKINLIEAVNPAWYDLSEEWESRPYCFARTAGPPTPAANCPPPPLRMKAMWASTADGRWPTAHGSWPTAPGTPFAN